jgi:hypothetical protein
LSSRRCLSWTNQGRSGPQGIFKHLRVSLFILYIFFEIIISQLRKAILAPETSAQVIPSRRWEAWDGPGSVRSGVLWDPTFQTMPDPFQEYFLLLSVRISATETMLLISYVLRGRLDHGDNLYVISFHNFSPFFTTSLELAILASTAAMPP